MKLKFALDRRSGGPVDLSVVIEPTATVADLAAALATRDPVAPAGEGRYTLVPQDGLQAGTPILADLSLLESGIRSGITVQVVADNSGGTVGLGAGSPVVATLRVVGGPDAGKEFPLPHGTAYIGRGGSCDVVLTDSLVSKRHAKIHVTGVAELIDTNSSNGILVSGEQVPRVIMHPEDVAVLGDTELMIAMHGAPAAGAGGTSQGTSVAFNRPPRLEPLFEGHEFVAPDLPTPPTRQRIPITPLAIPVVMAAVLLLVTKNPMSIAFVALSPLMMMGNFYETSRTKRREMQDQVEQFDAGLAQLEQELMASAEEEVVVRATENPTTAGIMEAVRGLQPLVWSRSPKRERFLQVRLGLGPRPSRTSVAMPQQLVKGPYLDTLVGVRDRYATVEPVPVIADLALTPLGVAGDDALAAEIAHAVVAQVVALHSPAEVIVTAVASPASATGWDWLKWLPHVSSPESPIDVEHLASGPASCLNLVAAIEDLIEQRAAADSQDEAVPHGDLWVVLLVNDDAPVERSRLNEIAESGPAQRVTVIWCSPSVERLPASCRTYVQSDRIGGVVRVAMLEERLGIVLDDVEQLDTVSALRAARSMAPMVDAGARTDDASDLPTSVSFVTLAGAELASNPEAVLDRWQESGSMVDRTPGLPRRRRKESGLRALIGRSATEQCFLDLRAHGPHALVGGTTGAGKSELLQSWIMGMATAYSPDRVTFLLVDYKGGSAFGQCRELPHTVGMVTDLSIALARRALTSLSAELKYREHVLSRKKAKDLIELERSGDPDAPPSLIIVVDEFAALVQELPEFVDGMVNVAQRGRSLGLHLILATQRPTGVVKGNLRANTNLRVALRMADEGDSTDVLGTAAAASFDPAIPGRAMAKLGPGRQVSFQAAYVGGITSDTPPPPVILVDELTFGVPRTWEEAEPAVEVAAGDAELTDIQRLVRTVRAAADLGAVPAPRLPWLQELAPVYNLRHLHTPRLDSELVFGVADDPENQRQPTVAFRPDEDGNLAVYGTGNAGKSTLLRSLAIASSFTVRGGPCQVYAVDFGSKGLQMLESLPHVGSIIAGTDTERVGRLFTMLRQMMDDRATRYSAAGAGTITSYRAVTGAQDEPRIFLMIDGMSAFRTAYEGTEHGRLFEEFIRIASDGRPVGVHVVLSADRAGALPVALSSQIQRRVVLRMADVNDYGSFGLPMDVVGPDSPPGRGLIDDKEIQVAVLGKSADISHQAHEIERLAEAMRTAGVPEAPPIASLTDSVRLEDLIPLDDGGPALGLSGVTLATVGFEPSGTFTVAGPPGSGRTTALTTVVASVKRWRPESRLFYFGNRRSTVLPAFGWEGAAVVVDEMAALASSIPDSIGEAGPHTPPCVVVIEGITDLLNGPADFPLQELIKAVVAQGHLVVSDGEPLALSASFPLVVASRSSRSGIVLQPEQGDGLLFRSQFPGRLRRADFPPGRGLFVPRGGLPTVVQVALP